MGQETRSPVEVPDTGTGEPHPVHEGILGSLDNIVVQLERLIENRSSESLQQPGQDGRWGVVEVLCHLRDWESIIHDRIWQITAGEQPEFEDPDATLWPLEHDYGAQDGHDVYRELAGMRRTLVSRLREAEEDAWERTGTLNGQGEITLRDFLEHVIEHDQRYLDEAREAMA